MERFKNQKYLIVAMVVAFIFLIVEAVLYSQTDNDTKDVKKISIIVYGKDSERWENLRNGAELACEKSDTEISLITMSSPYDYTEQTDLIDREVKNGADGLIIAACDSNIIGNYLKDNNYKIPIVFAETGIDSDYGFETVSADDYEMGKTLGEHIIQNEKDWIKVAIVSDNINRESVNYRYQGVYDVLSDYADEVVIWSRNENEKNMSSRKFLQRWLVAQAVDVVVTLDSETTDALMNAMDNLNKSRKVYSITTSYQSIYNLDHDRIKAIECQDEFGIGYLSTIKILEESNISAPKTAGKDISSRIVVRSDMYVGDTEKILFPFVK